MTNKYPDSRVKLNRLLDFVCDDSEMSTDDVKTELSNDGVDVAAFLKRIKTTIRHGIQDNIKKSMQVELKSIKLKSMNEPLEVDEWSFDKCVSFLSNIANGALGNSFQQKIALAYRNKDKIKPESVEDIRSCIKDILSLSDKDEK